MLKKYTKQAVLGASVFLLLLNVFFIYLFTQFFQSTANLAVNDVAGTAISVNLINMLIISAAVAAVVLIKIIYDYFKKSTSLSFYNWAAVGLLLELVVIVNIFAAMLNLK